MRRMLSAEEAQARREAEEEALALGLPQAKAAASTANFTNDAALRLKLEQLTGGVDTDADTTAWVETLTVTAQKLPVLDAQDDLKRDLAFYNQTLSAIRDVAAPRLRRRGVQYLADESQVGPLVSRFERDEPAKKRGKRKARRPPTHRAATIFALIRRGSPSKHRSSTRVNTPRGIANS